VIVERQHRLNQRAPDAATDALQTPFEESPPTALSGANLFKPESPSVDTSVDIHDIICPMTGACSKKNAEDIVSPAAMTNTAINCLCFVVFQALFSS